MNQKRKGLGFTLPKTKPKAWQLQMGLLGMALLLAVTFGKPADAGTAQIIEKAVKTAIDTRQETQARTEEWEGKRAELTVLYDRLVFENEVLTATQNRLSKERVSHQNLNQSLALQIQENLRIQREMEPFLNAVVIRLKTLIESDSPFLQEERKTRLKRLESMMADTEVPLGEKYRRVMEALSVEAEYGNTIEVYQDRILLKGNALLGDIFRLGRVSLFFLSLDRKSAGVFNVAQSQWLALDASHVPAIESGVEMAGKRRPVEILTLPLGRLAKE
ncbi:MAG: DUF3450 domain-containing protein [Proteobacteria bacterium]|nr:DUF3450 domain-containing protein [Desulfobacula sp.]MBU3951251.1 DUF3450 domain-containing protein [Pseudomonadota bacterium]MBU4130487.1 DUF3450 domain-containing protein [Pseudomonadota bacterium]